MQQLGARRNGQLRLIAFGGVQRTTVRIEQRDHIDFHSGQRICREVGGEVTRVPVLDEPVRTVPLGIIACADGELVQVGRQSAQDLLGLLFALSGFDGVEAVNEQTRRDHQRNREHGECRDDGADQDSGAHGMGCNDNDRERRSLDHSGAGEAPRHFRKINIRWNICDGNVRSITPGRKRWPTLAGTPHEPLRVRL